MFKYVIEIIQNQSDGEFILLKSLSGAKPVIKIVKVPEHGANEEESDEDINFEDMD